MNKRECEESKNKPRRKLTPIEKQTCTQEFRDLYNELVKDEVNANRVFLIVVGKIKKKNYWLKDYQIRDFVNQAIQDTYFGKRIWNPEIKLINYLIHTTKSIITNDDKKKKELLFSAVLEPEASSSMIEEWIINRQSSLAQTPQNIEYRILTNELLGKLDELGKKIARIKFESPSISTTEIAEELHEEPSHIRKTWKKIKRLLAKYLK